MNIVVFLGPSLDRETARRHLPDAIYLPPAGQSDLLSAIGRFDARVVGLIDGYFRHQQSVWHKEILVALAEGVHVFGSSSMGALRAAELAPYGMIGVGEVFDMYSTGTIDRDDEVALVHGDEESGYRPLSEPLVNIRVAVGDAIDRGIIDAESARGVLAAAAGMYYPDRTMASVIAAAESEGLEPRIGASLLQFSVEHGRDVKREDAILLLDRLAGLDPDLPPYEADFELERPHVLDAALDRDVVFDHAGDTATIAELAYHTALHRPDFNQFNFNTLNRIVVAELFKMLDVTLDAGAVEQEATRHRVSLGLGDDADFDDWLQRNRLTLDDFDELMTEVARCRRLHRWIITLRNYRGTAAAIADGLRLEDRFVEAADMLAMHKSLVDGDIYEQAHERLEDVEVRDMVLEHVRSTGCRMSIDYRQWRWEAGFPDDDVLAVELERSRRARLAGDEIAARLAEVLDAPDPP